MEAILNLVACTEICISVRQCIYLCTGFSVTDAKPVSFIIYSEFDVHDFQKLWLILLFSHRHTHLLHAI